MSELEKLKKKSEEAEEKYRSFLENYGGIAFKGYKDFSLDFFTGNVESITGYSEEDFVKGKVKFDQLIVKSDLPSVEKNIREFMKSSDKVNERRFRIRDKQGNIHYLHERVKKQYDSDLDKDYVYGTIQDITRYMEIKKELEKHKRELEKLVYKKNKDIKIKNQALDSSLSAIAITNMNGVITYVNSAFLDLWEYKNRREVIGKNGTEFWAEKDNALRAYKQVMRFGNYDGDILAQTKKGDSVLVDVKASLISENSNDPIGIVASFNDISRHFKIKNQLEEREKKLKTKLDHILSPDYEVDEEEFGNIINSERLQKIMDDFYALTDIGVAIVDMKGNVLVATGWQDICTEFHRKHPETRKNCIESDIYMSENAKPGEYLEYKCKNHMWDISTPIMIGEKRIGNLFLGQFFYKDEEVDYDYFVKQAKKYDFNVGEYLSALERVPRWSRERVKKVMDFYSKFASMISDLSYSNLKLANLLQEKEKVEEKLREEKNYSEFFKDLLAHDMGNILNNLKSSLELMKIFKRDADKTQKREEIMTIFENQVQRGINLVSNVNKLSEITNKEQKIRDVNVVQVLNEVIQNTSKQKKGKKVHISKDIAFENLFVKGGDLLNEAFENIISNAIIHNDKNEVRIWIEVSEVSRRSENMIKIEFKDNGKGINEKRKKFIFQKNEKKAKRKGGMGIGLSLVKKIIRGYDGQIWVENRIAGDYKAGSNFVILLRKT